MRPREVVLPTKRPTKRTYVRNEHTYVRTYRATMEGGSEDGEEEKRRGAEDGEEHCSGGDQPRAALSDGLFGGCRPLFFFF